MVYEKDKLDACMVYERDKLDARMVYERDKLDARMVYERDKLDACTVYEIIGENRSLYYSLQAYLAPETRGRGVNKYFSRIQKR